MKQSNSNRRMRKYLQATAFAAAMATSAVASATITYTFSPSDLAAYPGIPAGSAMLNDFDGTVAPGVTTQSYYITFSPFAVNNCAVGSDWTSCNSAIGTSAGAPPTGDSTKFLAVSDAPTGQGGVGFYQIGLPSSIRSVSFYWGSVNAWNFVQLLDAAGNSLVGGMAVPDAIRGTDLGAGTVDGFFGSLGSRLFTFNWDASDPVATLQFGDFFGPAMEIDNVTAVPEPGSLGLLALGTGLIGFLQRRRRSTAA